MKTTILYKNKNTELAQLVTDENGVQGVHFSRKCDILAQTYDCLAMYFIVVARENGITYDEILKTKLQCSGFSEEQILKDLDTLVALDVISSDLIEIK